MKKSILLGTSALTALVWILFILSIIYAPACFDKEQQEGSRVVEDDSARICKGRIIGTATVFRSVSQIVSIVTVKVYDHLSGPETRKLDVVIPWEVREDFIGENEEGPDIYFRLIHVRSDNWRSLADTMRAPMGIWVDETEARKNLESGKWELRFPEKEK
ncbi:hypothetical protein KY348_06680 [Candidatus Woesearchaeota archaeon]|nr:hypothetical protein [Candidatus Woesearchaeota archaeon]